MDSSSKGHCYVVRDLLSRALVLVFSHVPLACGETTITIVDPEPPTDPVDLTLDLLAYLASGGDEAHRVFQPSP